MDGRQQFLPHGRNEELSQRETFQSGMALRLGEKVVWKFDCRPHMT